MDSCFVLVAAAPDALDIHLVLFRLERHVDDLDRHVERRIALQFVVPAEVDDRADAVVHERAPAGRCEVPHAVGADDGAEPCRPAVLGAVPAQLANVEAALPVEDALGHDSRIGIRPSLDTGRTPSRMLSPCLRAFSDTVSELVSATSSATTLRLL